MDQERSWAPRQAPGRGGPRRGGPYAFFPGKPEQELWIWKRRATNDMLHFSRRGVQRLARRRGLLMTGGELRHARRGDQPDETACPPLYSLSIAKDTFHFSAAHMTVFPDGRKESLHGHNYFASLDVHLRSIAFHRFVDLATLKKPLKAICRQLDHRLLLADLNPYFEKLPASSPHEFSFELCKKRYLVPSDEVAILPLENISVEQLAQFVGDRWLAALSSKTRQAVTGFDIIISESKGQFGRYSRRAIA